MRRWYTWLLAAIAGILAGIVGLGLWIWSNLDGWIRDELHRQSEIRGIRLELKELSYGWGWVELQDVDFHLLGVDQFHGRLGHVLLELDGVQPKALRVRGAKVAMEGGPAGGLIELSRWLHRYHWSPEGTVEVAGISFAWRQGDRQWVAFDEGVLKGGTEGGSLEVPLVRLSQWELSPANLRWTDEGTEADLQVTAAGNTRGTLKVFRRPETPVVDLLLSPVPLEALATPLGLRLTPQQTRTLEVSAALRIQVPALDETGPVTGHGSVLVEGFIPPHPPELDALVTGSGTTVEGDFRWDDAATRLDIRPLTAKIGAVTLTGQGEVLPRKQPTNDPRLTALISLSGTIPCAALAGSATAAHLGSAAGQLAREIAGLALKGGVTIGLKIEVDSGDLNHPTIAESVSAGCGLKPWSSGADKLRQRIDQEAAKWKLQLPTDLPPIPDLGRIRLPARIAPKEEFAPAAPATASATPAPSTTPPGTHP